MRKLLKQDMMRIRDWFAAAAARVNTLRVLLRPLNNQGSMPTGTPLVIIGVLLAVFAPKLFSQHGGFWDWPLKTKLSMIIPLILILIGIFSGDFGGMASGTNYGKPLITLGVLSAIIGLPVLLYFGAFRTLPFWGKVAVIAVPLIFIVLGLLLSPGPFEWEGRYGQKKDNDDRNGER